MIRTGNEYKDSIRGNREVYMDGQRVNDVTTHPMFKPLIDIRARIYDMAHEPATKDVMTVEDQGEVNAIGNALPFTQDDWWAKTAGNRCRARRRRRRSYPGLVMKPLVRCGRFMMGRMC
jgi:aromatic ring hydroxylase